MTVSLDRVKALDRLRGLSIIYMLITHMFTWFVPQQTWWYYAAFPLSDWIGGCTFMFV